MMQTPDMATLQGLKSQGARWLLLTSPKLWKELLQQTLSVKKDLIVIQTRKARELVRYAKGRGIRAGYWNAEQPLQLQLATGSLSQKEPEDDMLCCGIFLSAHPINEAGLSGMAEQLLLAEAMRLLPLSGLFVCPSSGRHFYCCSDTEDFNVREEQEQSVRRTAILFSRNYGTAIALLPQIVHFVEQEASEGRQICIVTTKNKTEKLLRSVGLGHLIRFIDIRSSFMLARALMQMGEYERIIDLNHMRQQNGPACHITDLCAAKLGGSFDCFEWHPFLPPIPDGLRKNLLSLKASKKAVIGFQFHTDSCHRKSWPLEHAKKFVQLCVGEGIGVVMLTSHSTGSIPGVMDVGGLTVDQLIPIAVYLDLIVSIDSFAGHMASLQNIPSVTIWGRHYPHIYDPYQPETKEYISYRPSRRNYSLVAPSANSADIPPETVMSAVQGILEGRIVLKDGRITIEDTLGGVDVCWLEGANRE